MNFWDSSALLPLIVHEADSADQLELYDRSGTIYVWTLTSVEIESALARLRRERKIAVESYQDGIARCEAILSGCVTIKDVEAVKNRAARVLRFHPLKAADALQLAAALVACLDTTDGHRFVTLDKRLAAAAEKEGLVVS